MFTSTALRPMACCFSSKMLGNATQPASINSFDHFFSLMCSVSRAAFPLGIPAMHVSVIWVLEILEIMAASWLQWQLFEGDMGVAPVFHLGYICCVSCALVGLLHIGIYFGRRWRLWAGRLLYLRGDDKIFSPRRLSCLPVCAKKSVWLPPQSLEPCRMSRRVAHGV